MDRGRLVLTLKGLNKLVSNYERMVQLEKQNLKATQESVKEIETVKNQFIDEFMTKVNSTNEYAHYIDSSMVTHKIISSQIKNSKICMISADTLIQGKLLLEQKKFEEEAERKRIEDELQEKAISGEIKKKHLMKELSVLRRQFERIKEEILEEGTDIEDFEKCPQFKLLLDNLDTNKTLEQQKYQLSIRKAQLEGRNKTLTSFKEVVYADSDSSIGF